MRTKRKTVEVLKLTVKATLADHAAMLQDSCNNPRTCRYSVAVIRGATKLDMGPVTKPWADAGHLAFSLAGWRWQADTPKKMKADMLALDRWLKITPRALRDATPPPFDSREYVVEFRKKARVRKTTEAELKQMASRRKVRLARGEPDKKYHKYTFHDRVVGYA